MWQIINMYTILFLFFLLISALKSKIDNEDNHLCMTTDNITWECNFIPKEIPVGFSRVRIVNIVEKDQDMQCGELSFSTNDSIVEYVEIVNELDVDIEADIDFEKNCFTDLKQLKEIRIHSNRDFYLSSDVFVGLDNLETLDMSRCVRLSMDTLFKALDGSNKLTNLKHLILSSTGILKEPYRIDNTHIYRLARNISYIKMSNMELSHFNFTEVTKKLHNLEILDLSFSNIYYISVDGLTKSDLKNIKMVDLSFATLPMYVTGLGGTFRNLILTPQRNGAEIINTLFTVETMNLTGIVPTAATSIWLYNCTLFTDYYEWNTKHLILQQNNLKRLDAEWKCNNSNLQSLITFSLSHNGMEYIHPSIFNCMSNLEDIRMAHNSLFKMINENVTMFENLFRLSHSLKHIDLSHNDLTFIPYKTFGQNHRLEKLNISNNRLEQLHLNFETMKHLRVLDLSNNKLKILDTLSLNILKAFSVNKLGNSSATEELTVVLSSNPFSCSTCDSRDFIQWLTVTKSTNIESQEITCINENGDEEYIRNSTLNGVHDICNRTLIIIVASGSCGLLLLLVVIVIKVILLHRRKKQNDQKRAQVIAKVQHGNGPFEFLAMLSYSADDQEFATQYIKTPLNNYLKVIFGVNRNLILTGDEHFRLGLIIHDEISSSLERSSVVLFLVSKTFCRSTYCTSEFDEARRLKKPIILMFRENVDENLMTSGLRSLYKTNTRIIWTRKGGNYKLATTWRNVCTSIIDLLLPTV